MNSPKGKKKNKQTIGQSEQKCYVDIHKKIQTSCLTYFVGSWLKTKLTSLCKVQVCMRSVYLQSRTLTRKSNLNFWRISPSVTFGADLISLLQSNLF